MHSASVVKMLACIWLIGLFATAAHGKDQAPMGDQTKAAIIAAKAWLALIDAKEYKTSWRESSPLFKSNIKGEEEWERMIISAREPLGALTSRKLLAWRVSTALPGAPGGHYCILHFQSTFANKPDVFFTETITPMKVDKEWRVAGYFIQ